MNPTNASSTPNPNNQVRLLRVFVSSPGDVAEERNLIPEVLERVNRTDGQAKRIRLESFAWERDVVPQMGGAPQALIDAQTPQYDVYLGILAKRFGTPTGQFGSGTEHEFNTALEKSRSSRGQPWILFYFKEAPFHFASKSELDQYAKVLEFKEKLMSQGIISTYATLRGTDQSFCERLEHDLRMYLQRISEPAIPPSPRTRATPRRSTPSKSAKHEDAKLEKQFGATEEPTGAERRAQLVMKVQPQIFDAITPCYLLDENFFFLDWNTAFDELIAQPLHLTRDDHGLAFIKKLKNRNEVMEHSKKTFGAGRENPIVDTEILQVDSPKYGMMHFAKLAVQLCDDDGKLLAWLVNLNIVLADKNVEMRRDLEQCLKERLDWNRYALSYDRLLLPFDDYHRLIELVVGKLDGALKCADLGAGTGNGTLQMLKADPKRLVWAVDSSEAMLRYLRSKVRQESTARRDYRSRFYEIKDDICTLNSLRDKNDFFDAALLINVLYAVEDPVACLRQANRILKPGGILALSTPHRETDVDMLFKEMRTVLERRKKFEALRSNYEDAREVHRRMDARIHRDSKEDIRRYLEQAGFAIRDWHEKEYVGAVVVAKAEKVRSLEWAASST